MVETVDRKTRGGSREERTRAFDWDRSADHIRASGQNGRTQRPDTSLHPNASLIVRFLLHRGRRPYMTHCRSSRPILAKQTSPAQHVSSSLPIDRRAKPPAKAPVILAVTRHDHFVLRCPRPSV